MTISEPQRDRQQGLPGLPRPRSAAGEPFGNMTTDESERQSLNHRMLETAPIGMALTTAGTGRILWTNQAFARLIATSTEDVSGKLWSDLTVAALPSGGEGPDAPVEQQWATASGPRIVSIRSGLATADDGHPITVGIGEPEEVCLIHQVLDVTELRRTRQQLDAALAELQHRNQELERSNEDLTQFAYVASHDLSEPLRVIAGHVQLLASRYSGRLDEDADRYIEFAVEGCTRMRTLIEDLLRYSRAGREIRREPVDLRRLFERSLHDAAVTLGDRGAEIRLNDDLATVTGDPSQLGQVVANLVNNAVKFTPEDRRPVVEVSTERIPGGWRCTVADNGEGIAPQYRDRVFRVFQRLHSRRFAGTGIGLSICRRIIEQHGGRIEICDSPLGGTTIAFTLPDAQEVR
ncbi:MAG TPA: ATP-binding protein [Nocardioidaceae bacterium]|nr:ATP-binding protein [Nocardioidaceae bacterium]